jgi:hypothetical protein
MLGWCLDINDAGDVSNAGVPKVDMLDKQNADLGGVSKDIDTLDD